MDGFELLDELSVEGLLNDGELVTAVQIRIPVGTKRKASDAVRPAKKLKAESSSDESSSSSDSDSSSSSESDYDSHSSSCPCKPQSPESIPKQPTVPSGHGSTQTRNRRRVKKKVAAVAPPPDVPPPKGRRKRMSYLCRSQRDTYVEYALSGQQEQKEGLVGSFDDWQNSFLFTHSCTNPCLFFLDFSSLICSTVQEGKLGTDTKQHVHHQYRCRGRYVGQEEEEEATGPCGS
ncbi:hypothetical protein C8J56DRAFT_469820 [Mycena floridula]|nr:hypothetical protein C8J56DRAFT_469820 [Mycena floridula]